LKAVAFRHFSMAESCDTLVLLPAATAAGVALFGKNSDRPPEECQPLVQRSRASFPPSSVCKCQFVQIPQVTETLAHIGSRPSWCWGYEHGVNEHGVCIGNEAVFSKFAVSESPRLIGMELVRLGLERGASAAEAVATITGLVSKFGQGAFKNDAGVRTYDNGFIVADAKEAFVIETAGFHWAVKRVPEMVAISNCHSIGTDWDELSPECETAAITSGWWHASLGRLDFKKAFEDPSPIPYEGFVPTGEQRLRRQRELLEMLGARVESKPDAVDVMIHLCDHSLPGAGAGSPRWPWACTADKDKYATICRHSSTSQTTASIVAEIGGSEGACICWCSLYSPCTSVYFPVFPAGKLPAVLAIAAESEDSPWWLFRKVERLISAAPTQEARSERIKLTQKYWDGVQGRLVQSTRQLWVHGHPTTEVLTQHMETSLSEVIVIARTLLSALETSESQTLKPLSLPTEAVQAVDAVVRGVKRCRDSDIE